MGSLIRKVKRHQWKEGSSSFRGNKVNGKKIRKGLPWAMWAKMNIPGWTPHGGQRDANTRKP